MDADEFKKEQANIQAVRTALVEEATSYGYELVETAQAPNARPEAEIFRLTQEGFGFIVLEGFAQMALFLVEERLCRAGKLR